jgi:hypothetical protein
MFECERACRIWVLASLRPDPEACRRIEPYALTVLQIQSLVSQECERFSKLPRYALPLQWLCEATAPNPRENIIGQVWLARYLAK